MTDFPTSADAFPIADDLRGKKLDGSDGPEHPEAHENLGGALTAVEQYLIDAIPGGLLPADGTPGQVVTNTAAGEGDWADLPAPPIGLPADGTPGQVVTNTAPGLGDWEDLPAPPIGLPSDGTPGQVVTNTAPGEGDWEDLPAPPIGLPAAGNPGQVVTNTAPGLGDWEDLPAPPIGLPSGGSPGQVVTNTSAGHGDWEDIPTPSTPPGMPIVRAFPFAFDSPDLLTGLAIYTPTVGDVLLQAWVQIDTLWDGTTPQGDLTIDGSAQGAWSGFGGPINMGSPDFVYSRFPIKFSQNNDMTGLGFVSGLPNQLHTSSGTGNVIHTNTTYTEFGVRLLPAVFTSADPILVVVSQDGTAGGADPGSTQGSGIVYFVTATPVTIA